MGLTLLLESSSHRYSAALLDDADPDTLLAYRETGRSDPDYDGVPGLAAATLGERSFRELATIVVDVGPGNLTSVRSGVAWANALAYSAGVTLLGPNSLELLALSAWAVGGSAGEPVLALRKAGGTTVYAGLLTPAGGAAPASAVGAPPVFAGGELADVVKRLAGDLPAFTVAGAFRDRVAALAPGATVTDSALELPDAHAVHTWVRERAHGVPTHDLLVPLTENSELFRD